MTLTEAGESVLPYERAASAAVEGVRQAVDELTGLLRGRVALCLASGAAVHAFRGLQGNVDHICSEMPGGSASSTTPVSGSPAPSAVGIRSEVPLTSQIPTPG